MVNDTISDLLTRIRNANLIKSETVSIPLTRINKQISEILEKQGFIESFQIVSSPDALFVKSAKADFTSKGPLGSEATGRVASPNNNEIGLPIKQNLTSVQTSKNTVSVQSTNKNIFHYKGGILIYLKYCGREKKPCITNLKRISKPGLRIYANHKEIPKVLGGMGIAILSTSAGIMTDREARFQKIGGEVLCSIW